MRNETLKVRFPFTFFCFSIARLSHPKVLCLDTLFQPAYRSSVRAEESEAEQELLTMLRLVTFKDPGPAVSAQSTPKVSSKGPKNRVKPTSLSCLVLDPASPPIRTNLLSYRTTCRWTK